jgi:hypothetical protein
MRMESYLSAAILLLTAGPVWAAFSIASNAIVAASFTIGRKKQAEEKKTSSLAIMTHC